MKTKDAARKNVVDKEAEGLKNGKQKGKLSTAQMTSLMEELDRTGVVVEVVKERYRISEMGTMSEELYRKVMEALTKMQTAT